MTEIEILRGRLAAAEAGVEILTRERDLARARADAYASLLVEERQTRGRERARLARVLAFVEGRGERWFGSAARPRGRVWSRRFAP